MAVRRLSIDPKKRNGKRVQPTEADINTILNDREQVALLLRRLSEAGCNSTIIDTIAMPKKISGGAEPLMTRQQKHKKTSLVIDSNRDRR